MRLNLNEQIRYINSSLRYFYEGERHVSRVSDSHVLLLVFDGVLKFGENGEEKQVRAGEYYIQKAGLQQDGSFPSLSPKYYYVHFYGSFSGGGELSKEGKWDYDTVRPLIDRLEKLRERGGNLLQKSIVFYSILDELKRQNEKQVNPLAVQIMKSLTKSYRDKIRIDELASKMYISTNYLINVFKKEYGVTPHKFVTSLRLKEALQLLKDTNRSEEEIAFEVGFSDFSVFYKAFKSYYGTTPSNYRKK